MEILHIANKPIFPIFDGGQLATQKMLLNLLELGANVKHLCIETEKHSFSELDFPKDLAELVSPESHFISTKVDPFKAFFSYFSSKSYIAERFKSESFEKKIQELFKTNAYDFVVLESSFLLHYIDVIRKYSDAKIVVRTHNVEYRVWRQNAKKEKNYFKRLYFNKMANNLKHFEIELLNRIDGIFCISDKDKEFFRRRGIRIPMKIIPVYMDVNDKYEIVYTSNDFFFVGSMNWKPNIFAVKWILRQIAPKLKKTLPEAKIHIAGSSMSKKMQNAKTKALNNNVVFHGRVDDLWKFMTSHGTLIVPLKTGSGVRIKILEALSAGIPTISTDKGKEGIELVSKKHFLSANMTEEFILQMKFINDNIEMKKTLSSEAKAFIEKNYSKHSVTLQIREFLPKL